MEIALKSPSKENIENWNVLEFTVPIKESFVDDDVFIIKGTAINETTTLNNVKYIAEELIKAAASFRNVPILLDHKNEIKNIVGRTTEKVFFNQAEKKIDFEGKIMDKVIQAMIKDGRIQNVSIGAKVDDLIEEDDGSMRAVGVKGLEISLVAVPGDQQANFAQALTNSFKLKEMAKNIGQLNSKEEKTMTEEVEVEEPKVEEPEVKAEESAEEEKPAEEAEEPKEEVAEEKVKTQNITVKVDNSAVDEMKKEIAELKSLLVERKKLKEQAEDEAPVEDETKGEVSAEEEPAVAEEGYVLEKSQKGMALYKDYAKESSDTKLKRLVR